MGAEGVARASQLVMAPDLQSKERTSKGFSLIRAGRPQQAIAEFDAVIAAADRQYSGDPRPRLCARDEATARQFAGPGKEPVMIDPAVCDAHFGKGFRSEEHTSELQSLMRISYAVFCLKKKNKIKNTII